MVAIYFAPEAGPPWASDSVRADAVAAVWTAAAAGGVGIAGVVHTAFPRQHFAATPHNYGIRSVLNLV